MLALYIGPLKGGLFARPQLDVAVGFNHCSSVNTSKGRNRGCLVDNAYFGKNSSPLMVSCNSGCSEKLDYVNEREVEKVDVSALVRSLTLAETVDDVEEVLKDKGELSLRTYKKLMAKFGDRKKLKPALALVGWLKRKKNETDGAVGPDLIIYNCLLNVVKQCGKFAEAERILNEMTQEGILANVVTYNTMMIIYIDGGRANEALYIFDGMQKKGIAPTGSSHHAVLLALRKLEDADGVLKFFTEIKEKYQEGELGKNSDEYRDKEFIRFEDFTRQVCYQFMLRWLESNENRSIQVSIFLKRMDKAGLCPSRVECERLLWACKDEKYSIVAEELYDRIREKYSEISLSTCNHAIWLMGKAKKWEAALEIFEDMLNNGPEPNFLSYKLITYSFESLVIASKKRGLWRWGVKLLNSMEERGFKPQTRYWNMALLACSKAFKTSEAIDIFKRMVEQGRKPTVFSYGVLLSALERGELYNEAVDLWNHMRKVGVQVNVHAYTTMVSVFAGLGKFSMIDDMIQEMTSAGIKPNVITYNVLVTAFARNGMSTTAYEWFNRMEVQNISPNWITYKMLIEGLAKDGKPELAFKLYLKAQNEGLSVGARAYDAVVDSSLQHGTAVELPALGPRPADRMKQKSEKTLTEFSKFADVNH